MRNLIADYPCEFALRSGVVCVVPHDRFHVEEDAVDFVEKTDIIYSFPFSRIFFISSGKKGGFFLCNIA